VVKLGVKKVKRLTIWDGGSTYYLFLPYFGFYLSFVSLCLLQCFCMWTYSFSFGFLLHLTVFCTDINMKLYSMLLQDIGMWNHWRTSCWVKLRKQVRRSSKLIEAGYFQQACGADKEQCFATLSCILAFTKPFYRKEMTLYLSIRLQKYKSESVHESYTPYHRFHHIFDKLK